MKVEEIVEELSSLGRRKTDPLIWESMLYFFASVKLNEFSLRKTIGRNKFIRSYFIIFSSSGSGKDYSMSRVRELFDLESYHIKQAAVYDSISQEVDKEDKEENLRFMPGDALVPASGTQEGLFLMAKAVSESGYGSLNLFLNELSDSIKSNSELLGRLKELYDSELQAKIIKGNETTKATPSLRGVNTNFLGMSTIDGLDKEARQELSRLIKSGLYRRSFIIDSKTDIERNLEQDEISLTTNYLSTLTEKHRADFKARFADDMFHSDKYIEPTEDFNSLLDTIESEMIDNANSNKLSQFAQIDAGSLEMIIDLAHVTAFIEDSEVVDYTHLEKAYAFFKRTREVVEETFFTEQPYKLMYNLLHLKNGLTLSEMVEIDDAIPTAKTKVHDNIALLEELCYRNEQVLEYIDGAVTRFYINPLPENKLDKLIVSVHTEGKGKFAINYVPYEIKWDEMKKLVVSENVESFCTSHFEASPKAPDGHRRKDSYKNGSNMIALDVDDGTTLKEARELLKNYTYIIYTTKSHNIDKGGLVCDRYRIVLPTKNTFYVSDGQIKELYKNIELITGIEADAQTYNASRLFFTNSEAEVFENQGELFDVTYALPSTDKSDNYLPALLDTLSSVGDLDIEDEVTKRITGMFNFTVQNANEGQRNRLLYNLGEFCKEFGVEPEFYVEKANSMITKPLSAHEIKTILRSIR